MALHHSSGFQWILLYSTGIYLCVDFFIFTCYILGTFQVILGCFRSFQVIPVDSSIVYPKIATIFILDIICRWIPPLYRRNLCQWIPLDSTGFYLNLEKSSVIQSNFSILYIVWYRVLFC